MSRSTSPTHPDIAPFLDKLQAFDVYTSVWFSAIYLLLFASLIGCIIPRTKHHFDAMRAKPPKTPVRLSRMAGFQARILPAELRAAGPEPIAAARDVLRSAGYRVAVFEDSRSTSVSAERGYLRETGNLVFHTALLGVLVAIGIGGGFGYNGQKIVVVGQSFVNSLPSYNTFNPGRFFTDGSLAPFSLRVDGLDVHYETKNKNAIGTPLDYTAHVTATGPGDSSSKTTIKVNDPLSIGGTSVYLLGNGYAPTITVRDPAGKVVFTDSVPFIPQADPNLTSLGFVKIPDGLSKQVGMIGFFYPDRRSEHQGGRRPRLLVPRAAGSAAQPERLRRRSRGGLRRAAIGVQPRHRQADAAGGTAAPRPRRSSSGRARPSSSRAASAPSRSTASNGSRRSRSITTRRRAGSWSSRS